MRCFYKKYLPALGKMAIAGLLTMFLYLIFNVLLRAIASVISEENGTLQNIISFIIMYLLQVVYCWIFIWYSYDRPGLGVKRLRADYKEEPYHGIPADIKKLAKTELPILIIALILVNLIVIYKLFPVGLFKLIGILIGMVFVGITGMYIILPAIPSAVLCFLLFCITYLGMLALFRKKWNKEWN